MAELKRVLGFWTVLSLSIASIMGTGMFFSISLGSQIAGPGIIFAWIGLTLLGLYISTFFGELVSMFPTAGGLYEFSKQAYSRFMSFMVGWTAWIIGNITTALLVVAAIDYILPSGESVLLKIMISILFIVLLNVIAYYGIEASAFILLIFAAITVGLILIILVPGFFAINKGLYGTLLPFGASSILIAVFLLAESFFGWESTTYLAEETKNPEKVIPKALMWGTLVVGVLGTGLAVVSLGIIPWAELAVEAAPLSVVSTQLFGSGFTVFLNLGIFVTLVGSAAGGIITMPRLILALARDKLFIAQLADIHPKHNTPHKAIFFQTIVSIIIFFMAFGRYEDLLNLTLPIGFLLYTLTLFIVLKLRYTKPHVHRPFKVIGVHFGAPLLMLGMMALLFFWVTTTDGAFGVLRLALSFVFLGVPIYLLLQMYHDPDVIVKTNDWLAYFTLWLENFILPHKVRKQILTMVGDIKGKTVLEFGCSVGTITSLLAEQVTPTGRIYATDLSWKESIIAQKRIHKKGHQHVTIIHDQHQVNRIHPHIPAVDAVVSVGMMGYMQDVKKVLKEMYDLMPYGGKIVFVDYADFFKVIPNVKWLVNDREIEKIFREVGFSVFVKREQGLFWNYIYVYGIKFYKDIPYI